MALELTNFRVELLNGKRSIDIPIRDNRLVLVGENGSGKTTLINLLYYFLSRQWSRLCSSNFKSMSVVMNGEELSVTVEDLRPAQLSNCDRPLPSKLRGEWARLLMAHKANPTSGSLDRLVNLGYRRGLSARAINELLFGFPQAWSLDPDELYEHSRQLRELDGRFQQVTTGEMLYLPTYRRIEQDLHAIFPGVDVERIIGRRPRQSEETSYTELIEFGMEDVVRRVDQKMTRIKDHFRSGLNQLTGSYLREILSGAYQTVDLSKAKDLAPAAVESVLSRIEENILPAQEKDHIRQILATISQQQVIADEQKVTAHFLLKLLEFYEMQQQEESSIRRLIAVCNRYVSGKQLVYDEREFNIRIVLAAEHPEAPDETISETISMMDLSSGEKQIVSLFSHLFLSDEKEFFVLIDEPELSLSVNWQRTFLPDIIGTGCCTGLVAVTHSPFVFDNELDSYAHSIQEFVK